MFYHHYAGWPVLLMTANKSQRIIINLYAAVTDRHLFAAEVGHH